MEETMSSTRLRWKRSYPDSQVNFDLELTNSEELEPERLAELLKSILKEAHSDLTRSSRACEEFERWFREPNTPLKSSAIVLLSNWFTTRSGDRHSAVASRCEALWDALFPCRPTERLSSPKAGHNHVALPAAFERFWEMVRTAQGKPPDGQMGGPSDPNLTPSPSSGAPLGQLRATIHNKAGLRCEVEGSPKAVADFFRMLEN